jgi:hypothetical protein
MEVNGIANIITLLNMKEYIEGSLSKSDKQIREEAKVTLAYMLEIFEKIAAHNRASKLAGRQEITFKKWHEIKNEVLNGKK